MGATGGDGATGGVADSGGGAMPAGRGRRRLDVRASTSSMARVVTGWPLASRRAAAVCSVCFSGVSSAGSTTSTAPTGSWLASRW